MANSNAASPKFIACAFGLALCWFYFAEISGLLRHFADAAGGSLTTSVVFAAGGLIVIGVFCGFAREISSLFARRALVIVVGALLTCANGLLIGTLTLATSRASCIALALVADVTMAVMLPLWLQAFVTGHHDNRTVYAVLGSLVLACLLSNLCPLVPWGTEAAVALCPAISMIACSLAGGPIYKPSAFSVKELRAMPLFLLLKPMLLLFLGAVAGGIISAMGVPGSPTVRIVTTAICALIVFLIMSRTWHFQEITAFVQVFLALILFLGIGVALLAGSYNQEYGIALVNAGQGCLFATLFLIVSYKVVERKFAVLPLALILVAAPKLVCDLVVDLTRFVCIGGGVALPQSLMLVAAMVVVFVLLVADNVFAHKNFNFFANERTAQTSSEKMHKIAAEYGLTERELDVIAYILQGYSVQAAADALFISRNTAASHLRKVYNKMNIHSKEDLVFYFINQMGGPIGPNSDGQ